jgi:hypothetical protein
MKMLFVALLVLVVTPFRSAYAEIEIIDAKWTDFVWADIPTVSPDKRRQFKTAYNGTAPVKPLYLWMKVKLDEKALDDAIANDGVISLSHLWFYAHDVKFKSVNTDKVDFSIFREGETKKTKITQLKRTIKEKGNLPWRIWSMKENIKIGEWRVKLYDSNGSPLSCNEEECQLSIHVVSGN